MASSWPRKHICTAAIELLLTSTSKKTNYQREMWKYLAKYVEAIDKKNEQKNGQSS